jgi:hypothetical protein
MIDGLSYQPLDDTKKNKLLAADNENYAAATPRSQHYYRNSKEH